MKKQLTLIVVAVAIAVSSLLSACSNENPINKVPMSQQVEQMLAGDNPQNLLSGGN